MNNDFPATVTETVSNIDFHSFFSGFRKRRPRFPHLGARMSASDRAFRFLWKRVVAVIHPDRFFQFRDSPLRPVNVNQQALSLLQPFATLCASGTVRAPNTGERSPVSVYVWDDASGSMVEKKIRMDLFRSGMVTGFRHVFSSVLDLKDAQIEKEWTNWVESVGQVEQGRSKVRRKPSRMDDKDEKFGEQLRQHETSETFMTRFPAERILFATHLELNTIKQMIARYYSDPGAPEFVEMLKHAQVLVNSIDPLEYSIVSKNKA